MLNPGFRTMIAFSVPILIVGLYSASVSGQSVATKQSKQSPAAFSLIISGPVSIKAGAPLKLNVRLINTSGQKMNMSVEYDSSGVNYGYVYQVTDQDGKTLDQKEHEWSVSRQNSSEAFQLKPGESFDDTTLLSAAFNLTRPGKYTVQVCLPASNTPGAPLVKSNKLVVTIEE